MNKILLSFLLIFLISAEMEAQRRNTFIRRRIVSTRTLELSMGPNYAFGDPDCSKGIFGPVINQSFLKNYDFTAGFRQVFQNNIGYKASVSYDHFTGEDLVNPRGYSFATNAFQFNVQAEYHYNWNPLRFRRAKPNTLYGFVGLGALYSDVDLKYANFRDTYIHKPTYLSPVIPYGFGYRYNFQKVYFVGAEVKLVYAFSDFIDGFKPPRPSSMSNDVINGISVTFGYKIP